MRIFFKLYAYVHIELTLVCCFKMALLSTVLCVMHVPRTSISAFVFQNESFVTFVAMYLP